MAQPRRLIVALGNPLAGDDGFGNAVVGRLRQQPEVTAMADLLDAGTDLLAHIESLASCDEVVLVDAVVGEGGAGEVVVVDEHTFREWPDASPGSHAISPLLAVKLFRRLHPEASTRISLVALETGAVRLAPGVSEAAVTRGVEAVKRLLE